MKTLLMSFPKGHRDDVRGALSAMKQSPVQQNMLIGGRLLRAVALAMTFILLASCTPVDLNAPIPTFETGIDSNAWAQIPAGEFYFGQHNEIQTTDAYEIMVTDVTAAQYADFLNAAFADGYVKVDGEKIVGFYPGDEFRGVKHEEKIEAGDWLFVPLNDRSQRIKFDGSTFTIQSGYENHPMTMVSWFGAWGYCKYYESRLPTEMEWEKAARGPSTGSESTRPFPWGEEIQLGNANFYSSRDPFENMTSFGSRTSPVGFYNGQKHGDYQTLDSASPYGLYDMAGNVWQWTGNVYEGMHYRFMRGGSKDVYDMDIRVWVRNNATPTYVSPGVGFRCVK
jgi:formylglycine-generating enzyme required for sulfatase activity